LSAREQGIYWITLTYRPNELKGVQEEDYRKLTDSQLRKLLASLRDKAKRESWNYNITLSPSITNLRNGKKERLHIHVLIEANPACTAVKYIREYWHKRHGIADIGTIYDKAGYLGYMQAQAMYTKTQTEGFLES
jgi:hypothetical protein